jgi:hypothetical protein
MIAMGMAALEMIECIHPLCFRVVNTDWLFDDRSKVMDKRFTV